MRLFEVYNKEDFKYPLVISLPHSGQAISEPVRQRMLPKVVLPNMDWFLPELYAFSKPMGVTVLINNISRYVADPNRDAEITGKGEYSQTIVYQKNTWDRQMYETPLISREIAERIQNFLFAVSYGFEGAAGAKAGAVWEGIPAGPPRLCQLF